MRKNVTSIIGVILIVLLAIGFIIEYKAVNTSIEHNLTVAAGDMLNVMDDAKKNWEKRRFKAKKAWNEKMSTTATRALRAYCRTCEASVFHKQYSLMKLYDYFANSASMNSVQGMERHRNKVLKIKSIIKDHNDWRELKDVAASQKELEEALK